MAVPASIAEDAGTSVSLSLVLNNISTYSGTVTISFDAANSTVTNGSDVSVPAFSGSYNISQSPSGQYMIALPSISIFDDQTVEGFETIAVKIKATGLIFDSGPDETIVRIVLEDDDGPGTSGADTLTGGVGTDLLAGRAGNDFFCLQQGGDDQAAGGADNDAFYFGGALTAADRVSGGTGAGVVALQGNYAGLTLGATTLAGIETLSALSGTDARFGDTLGNRYDYLVTTVNATVATGTQLKVNAAQLEAGEDLAFNGAAERDGSFFIYGGKGSDLLTGGGRNDVFRYQDATESTRAASDRISDFAPGDV
ncbi:MAG: calcium-binding protein, partial [Sphingomonas bacterium]|nr:calcium-binding protein [Sphingomonas bacterium]